MAYTYPSNLEDKRNWVRALLLACPMEEALESCPLQDIRELSFEDITKISETLDEIKLDEIIAYHQECLSKRVSRSQN
jgi:hypothetical protein